jgi:hypothetical protein
MPFVGMYNLVALLTGASYHIKEAVFQKGRRIFNMSTIYDVTLFVVMLLSS